MKRSSFLSVLLSCLFLFGMALPSWAAVTIEDVTAVEESGSITFKATSDTTSPAFTVDVVFGGGSAVSGTDYDGTTQTLSFSGSTGESETFVVPLTDDAIVESDKTFVVSMQNLVIASGSIGISDTATGTITNTDTTTVTIADVSVNESGAMVFAATATNAVDGGFILNVTFAGGSATGGGADYTSTAQAINFVGNAGESQNITVPLNDDNIVEPSEDFIVSQNSAHGGVITTDGATGTITDTDTATVTIADVSVNESGVMNFSAVVDNAVDGGFAVTVAFVDGSATGGGVDYTSADQTLNFVGTSGESQAFTVALNDDTIVESSEGFTVNQSSINGGVITTDDATGTITDTDTATVTIADVSVNESGVMNFSAVVDNAVDGGFALTIEFDDGSATGGGVDYTSADQTLNFVGTSGESQAFTVALNDDTIVESSEDFTVNQSSINAGVITTDEAIGTIIDTDTATVTIADVSVNESGAMTFSAVVDNEVDGGFDLELTFTDGTATGGGVDYTSTDQTVNFAGNAAESQSFTVALNDDAIVETSEDFTVNQSSANGAISTADNATGTITDTDTATVSVAATVGAAEPATDGEFTVTMSQKSSTDTVISYALDGGGGFPATSVDDYVALTGSVTIYAEDTEAVIAVEIEDDDIVESSETLGLTLSGTDNAQISVLADHPVMGFGDDDVAILTVNDVSVLEKAVMTFTVTVDNAVAGGFDVDATFTDGSATGVSPLTAAFDYNNATQTLTFAGTPNETQTVTVALTDDIVVELEEDFKLVFNNLIPAEAIVAMFDITDSATGTILNDEHFITMTPDQNGIITGPGAVVADGANGPADNEVIVDHDTDATFFLGTAAVGPVDPTCFHIVDVQANGVSQGAVASYTFLSVATEDNTLTMTTAINEYIIESIVYGDNGSITPTQTINCGADSTDIEVQADTDHHISWVKVDGGDVKDAAWLAANCTYDADGPISCTVPQFTNVAAPHIVEAAFSLMITIREFSPFGKIEPPGTGDPYKPTTIELAYEDSQTFTVSAFTCPEDVDILTTDCLAANARVPGTHHISDVLIDGSETLDVDGNPVWNTGTPEAGVYGLDSHSYTFSNVTANHDIEVLFTSFVEATVHGNGNIVETDSGFTVDYLGATTGTVEVPARTSPDFIFTPAEGFHVEEVLVDTNDVGQPGHYVFNELEDDDHTLEVTFAIDNFVVEPVSTFDTIFEEAAETTVATTLSVDYNVDATFFVNLDDPDHVIFGVLIDNIIVDMPATNTSITHGTVILSNVNDDYLEVTFTAVKASHRLEVRDYDTAPLADVPMDVKLKPNAASIMFLMDDSGSMDMEIATSGEVPAAGWHNDGYVFEYPRSADLGYHSLFDQNREDKWPSQWGMVNKMYYQPEEVYVPWPNITSPANEPGLPAVSADDGEAHANIYRPRYQPWYSQDCLDALGKQTDGAHDRILAGCDPEQTFDMDGIFIALGGAADDHGDSMAEATEIDANSNFQATINSSREHDYFRIEVLTEGDLTVRTLMDWACTDIALRILDNNGDEYRAAEYDPPSSYYTPGNITYADDCGWDAECDHTCDSWDRNPYISLDAVPAGTYYLDVRGWDRETGSYVLDVSLVGGTSTTPADPVPVPGSNIINAHYFTWEPTAAHPTLDYDDADGDGDLGIGEEVYSQMWLVNLTYPIQYHKVVDNDGDITAANLTYVPTASVPADVQTYNVLHGIPIADSGTDAAYVQERQNWADWFSYYRKRSYAATAATARALVEMEGVNIGLKSINYRDGGTYAFSQAPLPVNVFGEEDRTDDLLRILYEFRLEMDDTPLRNALESVGEWADDTDDRSGYVCEDFASGTCDPAESPFHNGVAGDECKQVFTILMTDGYYNGSNPNIGDSAPYNIDGDNGEPYADNSGNTLADVAMYFYERDLSSLEDLVPDDVPWQHMVTYTVAFGVKGSLDPDDYDFDNEEYPDWPPLSQNEHRIDDLWHAAVNGHGKYLNVDTPSELVQALLDIMDDIVRRIGSGASVSVNGDELYENISGNIRMFQTSYNSGDWSGDIVANYLDTDGVVQVSDPVWSAEETLAGTLGADGSGHVSRVIATYDGTSGTSFAWNNLSTTQQQWLTPYFDPSLTGSDVVSYLRGDKSNEGEGLFRVREKTLGDFVNSLARFQRYEVDDSDGRDSDDADWDPTYEGVLYVGGNDGMLHAFMANDEHAGSELFAYIPGHVYFDLRELSDPDYDHKFYVDNTPYTAEVSDAKTVLVGGLGKGGKGYYSLDITNAPTAINSEGDLASRVMWEFPEVPEDLYSGDKATFSAGAIGGDVIVAPAGTFTGLVAGDSIRIAGAICSTDNNDGEYRLIADATITADGKSSVQVSSRSLVSGCGNDEDVTILPSADPRMGFSFSRPLLVRSNDTSIGSGDLAGWVVIFGNGYDSDTGTASLFMLDPVDGSVVKHIETGVGPLNGMSTPKVIDPDNNLTADYVYAGDLLGNMWKFDLTSSDSADWQVAYCENADASNHCRDTDNDPLTTMEPKAKPLFGAMGNQPITAAPDIMFHQYGPGYTVIFGTGKYLGLPDIEYYTTQSIYGIWDWATDDNDLGYLGVRVDDNSVDPIISHLSHAPVTDIAGNPVNTLLRQGMLFEGLILADTNGNGTQDAGEDLSYYRIPTNHEGDWALAGGVPQGNLGWVVDLPGKLDLDGDGVDNDGDGDVDESGEHLLGERVVNDTIIRDNRAIVISFLPLRSGCGAGAYSFLNERNVNTGGMPYEPVFDLDGDGDIDWDDVAEEWTDGTIIIDEPIPSDVGVDGRLFNPVILREDGEDPDEKKYLSSSAGRIEVIEESAEKRGVYYWQQVE